MRTKSDPYLGQVLGDRYMVMRQLGIGGMATVYAAQHTLIGRMVAIKVLHAQFATDESCVRRFMNEGRAAGTLGHPNIVESTDMGFAPDGAPFLVLELLDGCNLSHEVHRCGPLEIKRAARIGVQIASALRAAHSHNIIHRDLKPENIFIIPNDEIKAHVTVLDFGISTFLNAGRSLATQQGALMGTPDFMAPEQVTSPDSIDRRIDVYAVGAIMYHMVAGVAPFHEVPFPQIFNKIQDEDPPPLGDMRLDAPNELCDVVAKAMAKRPDERYQDMNALLNALLPFAGGSIPQIILKHRSTPIAVPVSPRAETLPAASLLPVLTPGHQTPVVFQQRSSRWALFGSAAAVIAAGVAIAVVLLRDQPKETPAVTPASAAEVETAIDESAATQDEALALYLDEVERLASLQRFDAATAMLAKAKAIGTDDAGLDIRRARVSDELAAATRAAGEPDQPVAEAEATTVEQPPADPSRRGLLYVRSSPKGTVYVDGVPIGKTPIRRHAVAPGEHSVEVRRMGYHPEQRSVEVRSKRKARISVNLHALSDAPVTPDAAPAVEPIPEPEPVVAKRTEPKPPPETHTEKAPPKALAERKPDPDAIATPRLPKVYEVDSTKALARALRIIEKEAMDRGRVPEKVASGCTAPLARTLFDSYAPGKTIRLRPRTMYYTIVRGARAGNSRDDIAAKLKAGY